MGGAGQVISALTCPAIGAAAASPGRGRDTDTGTLRRARPYHPRVAFCAVLGNLPAPDLRLVLYAHGWHMLTRDLQRERVMGDIAA